MQEVCTGTEGQFYIEQGLAEGIVVPLMGPTMSPVDFMKWKCPLSLFFFFNISVNLKIVKHRLSVSRNNNGPCCYFFNILSDLKKSNVTC